MRGLPPVLVRRLLLPLHERLRGRSTLRELALMRGRERDAAAFDVYCLERLEALLRHAARHVPHYREAVCGAPRPALTDFPVLERHTVRSRGRALCSEVPTAPLLPASTGGSTGTPMQFWTDRVKETRHNAQKLRFRLWYGVHPGERQVDFWGSPIELGRSSRLRRFKDRYLLNQVICSAHDLSPGRIEAYARFLGGFRPRLVYGYPTVIDRVARYIAAAPESVAGWQPRVVVSTSEMLYPQQRATIAEVLKCPVANEYGARDGGLIAHECPAGSLHIAADHAYVEVADADADGVGDLLVTNLDGYGMPLIRYRVGDRGRLGTGGCACGSVLPVLDLLEGRRNDFLLGCAGRRIHGSAANYVLREVPGVIQYRLRQRADCSLEVQLVTTEEWDAARTQRIREGLLTMLGMPVPVRIEHVAAIEPTPAGKYRWVESEALEP